MAAKDDHDVAWPLERQQRRAMRHFLFHSCAPRLLPVQETRAAAHTDGGEVYIRARMHQQTSVFRVNLHHTPQRSCCHSGTFADEGRPSHYLWKILYRQTAIYWFEL
ncbi:hypothetical protein ILYODFUR_020625 [Ilyodon furcidens]|uniref:Uncharacterized protein n=1 Tax=Ilyodon furcidens TaxID=33524 RepID=A0ABV0TAV8_9TELE